MSQSTLSREIKRVLFKRTGNEKRQKMKYNEKNNEIGSIPQRQNESEKDTNVLCDDSKLFGLINQVENNSFVPQTRDYRGSVLKTYLEQLGRLTSLQKQVLVGILLGDATLRIGETAKNPNLKYDQSIEKKDLVNLIYLIFEPFVGTPPSVRKRNGKDHSFWFRTFRLPELDFYHKQFYTLNGLNQCVRGVPELLHRWITPISLAFWFMDDGRKTKYGYYLHTECFSLTDCKYLQRVLGKNFGLEVGIHRDQRANATYYKLSIRASSRDKFTQLVRPYILSCMQYKLHA